MFACFGLKAKHKRLSPSQSEVVRCAPHAGRIVPGRRGQQLGYNLKVNLREFGDQAQATVVLAVRGGAVRSSLTHPLPPPPQEGSYPEPVHGRAATRLLSSSQPEVVLYAPTTEAGLLQNFQPSSSFSFVHGRVVPGTRWQESGSRVCN